MEPVFPAVTCTAQASILTGKYPNEHGIICNGLYDKNRYEVSFWDQSNSLVQADRIWDLMKKRRPQSKSAIFFGQNTMYSTAEIVVTPRPLHMADETIMWCYSRPQGYYEELKRKFGEFNLASYWGPLASSKSSEWIVKAALNTLELQRPNFLFIYIPHVDYSAQKFGKESKAAQDDLKKADELVGEVVQNIANLGIADETLLIIFSEYSFTDVSGFIPLNQTLRDANLLAVRDIQGKEYLDLEYSPAFAMVDHQVAHVYVKRGFEDKTRKALENIDGVKDVLTSVEKKKLKIDHSQRSGDLIAISEKDRWFNYSWWYESDKAPKFAKTIDIHRKPGYDPLELFFDHGTRNISQDPSLIKASHGLPADIQKDEGLAVYVSNRRSSMLEKSSEAHNISSITLGNHLIKLLAT